MVFAGKLVGTVAFEPIAERIGYKNSMYLSAVIQCIAIIGQSVIYYVLIGSVLTILVELTAKVSQARPFPSDENEIHS